MLLTDQEKVTIKWIWLRYFIGEICGNIIRMI